MIAFRTSRAIGGLAAVAAVGASLAACSGARVVKPIEGGAYPEYLRVRWPPGLPAANDAVPGGVDYVSEEAERNEVFDCQKPEWLLRELDLAGVMGCFDHLKNPVKVTYRLVRDYQPFWELQNADDPDEVPECLAKTLPRIPVPREVLFVTKSREKNADPECYALRIPIEADRWLGIRLPKAKMAMDLVLPPARRVTHPEVLRRILIGWSLSAVWTDESGRRRQAKFVPDTLCKRCMGMRELPTRFDPMPETWPFYSR